MFDLKEFQVFVYLKLLTINYIRMKKILVIGAFLFSFVSNAQYFVYGFNIVPDDEVEHYIQNESELFSKAAYQGI